VDVVIKVILCINNIISVSVSKTKTVVLKCFWGNLLIFYIAINVEFFSFRKVEKILKTFKM